MDVEKFLSRFVNLESSRRIPYPMKLERMKHLLSLCGNPQHGLQVLTVAGSKGKGSTAAIMASILRQSGWDTGLYTSPHLTSWHERIQFNGHAITSLEGSQLALEISLRIEGKNMPWGTPTYFEVMTTLALLYFSKKKAQAVVLEVGLGGEFDATHVCEPVVSVITPIGYEHQAVLGPTLTHIAKAKCGIIWPGGRVVSARQHPEAFKVILDTVKEKNALLHTVEKWHILDMARDSRHQEFYLESSGKRRGPFEIPLLGWHQLENASCAALAVETFGEALGVEFLLENFQNGFKHVTWEGRVEVFSENPMIILDGAHNEESAENLVAALKRHFDFNKIHLILGMLEDKDPVRFVRPFKDQLKRIWITPVQSERSFDPAQIHRRIARLGLPARVVSSLHDALEAARGDLTEGDLILITGSLYLVGEAKSQKLMAQTC